MRNHNQNKTDPLIPWMSAWFDLKRYVECEYGDTSAGKEILRKMGQFDCGKKSYFGARLEEAFRKNPYNPNNDPVIQNFIKKMKEI